MQNIQGAIAEQIFAFLSGPPILTDEKYLLISQSGANDIHVVTYQENQDDREII